MGTGQNNDDIFGDVAVGIPPNEPPTNLTLTGAATVAEGSTYTLDGSFEDINAGDSFTVTIDWGDGTAIETLNLAADVKTFNATHVYAEGTASYAIDVTVADAEGETVNVIKAVQVDNVPPTSGLTGADNLLEGELYTLTIDPATDIGDDTVSEYVVNWGDGSEAERFTTPGDQTHSYTDSGTYTITLSLRDEEGIYQNVATQTVTVNNVEPTLTITGAPDVAEGSEYTLTLGNVTDPGDDTVTQYIVDWGDGVVETYGAAGEVTHTYADGDQTYAISVSLVDEDGTYGDVATTTVDVVNVDPTLTLSGNLTGTEGSAYVLDIGAVTDPGTDTITAYTVDWGDGTTPAVFTTSGAKTHVYADNGNYTISIELADEDGTYAAVDTLNVSIANVAPTITLGGANSGFEGSDYTLTINSPTDPGNDTISAYIIDWGDGSATQTVTNPGDVIHVYADDDAYTISLTLVDEDGTYIDAAVKTVNINNVAPTIALSDGGAVDEGAVYTLTLGAVTDPGDDTVDRYLVDWGDGSDVEPFDVDGDQTHVYADNGTYTVRVSLRDEDGTFSNVATQTVVITNVAPTIAVTAPTPVDEGSLYELDLGAVTDPGDDTVSEYIVNWGDGTSDTYSTNGIKTHV